MRRAGSKGPEAAVEAAAVRALRLGDVKKALQCLVAAPVAPKGAATLAGLRALHPSGPTPVPVDPHVAPVFITDLVMAALSSFRPGSAAGLFGYTRSSSSSVHVLTRGPSVSP